MRALPALWGVAGRCAEVEQVPDQSVSDLYLEPPANEGLRQLVAIADSTGVKWQMPGFFTLPDGRQLFHLVLHPGDETAIASAFMAQGWACRARPE